MRSRLVPRIDDVHLRIARHTPELDFSPPLPAEGKTLSDRFDDFDRNNPHVFANLQILAETHGRRGERISVKLLFEELRNLYRISTRFSKQGGEYALDNSFTSFYARKLRDVLPSEYAEKIEIRKQRVIL
ncbi:MAG: hypothetical protein AAGU26_05875 [bacterium]|jgi:hypothetical protein